MRARAVAGRARVLAALAGSVAALGTAGTAVANEPVPVISLGADFAEPGPSVGTPDGAIWAVDHVQGLCKVDPIGPGNPTGSVIHDTTCGPLGPPNGPVEISGVAFDPGDAPLGDEFFYVSGASIDGEIWRMRWDQTTGTIPANTPAEPDNIVRILEFAVPLNPGSESIDAIAYSPASGPNLGVIDFMTKRTGTIWRLVDPASCPAWTPASPCDRSQAARVNVVGTPAVAGLGLAHLGGALYLAEDVGITRIENPVLGSNQIANLVPNSPPGVPSAIAAEPNPVPNGPRLYVASQNGSSGAVWAMRIGQSLPPVAYATSFTFPTGLGLATNGDIFVGDTTGGGAGRLYRVPFHNLNVPHVALSSTPPKLTNSTVAFFQYSTTGDAGDGPVAIQCRLVGAGSGNWESCGTGIGSKSFAGLLDGSYSFQARGINAAGTGPIARHDFDVDTVGPKVKFDNRSNLPTLVPSGSMTFRFSSPDDPTAVFQCSLDDAPWTSCDSPHTVSGLGGFEHSFAVRALDAAGNIGDTDDFDFNVNLRPPPPAPVIVLPAVVPVDPHGPVTANWRISGRRMIIRIPHLDGARRARITIEEKGRRRANGLPSKPRTLVTRVFGLKARGTTTIKWQPRSKRVPRLVNLRAIRVMVKVGPRANDLGSGRSARKATRARFWRVRGKAVKKTTKRVSTPSRVVKKTR